MNQPFEEYWKASRNADKLATALERLGSDLLVPIVGLVKLYCESAWNAGGSWRGKEMVRRLKEERP